MTTTGPGQSALLLLDAASVLTSDGIDYAVIGALAASVHGVVRASVDADAVLSIDTRGLRQLERQFADAGYEVQLREGDFQDPVPAVLVIKDGHGNRVDLLGGIRGLEAAAFSRTVTVPFQGKSLRVIGLEDLIAMKVFAGAPKDLNDAGAAIQVAGDALDLDLLRRLAKGYGRSTAETLEKMLKA